MNTTPDMLDEGYPQWERDTDQVCIDFSKGITDRATAVKRLVALGMNPVIVEEGIDNQIHAKDDYDVLGSG